MNGTVVVDASLAFKWLVLEEDSDKATALTRVWAGDNTQIVAPHFMPAEVTNALHRRVMRSELALETAASLMHDLMSLGIVFLGPPNIHGRALELATQLNQTAVYDSHYLALAETLNCALWTADARFYRAAAPITNTIHWIGDFLPPE